MALEMYEKYRDSDGYIDLEKAELDGLFDSNTLRAEVRGSDRSVGLDNADKNNALKGWFDFASNTGENSTFLVRTNMFRGEEANYGDYAELIVEEFAKEMGIYSPHYDLFKYKGEKGVLSQKLFNGPEYTMISLGDGLSSSKQNNITLEEVDALIERTFKMQGKSDKDVEKVKEDLRKIYIFDTLTSNEDRHLGNIGIVSNSETGELKLAIYDNEISLLLSKPKIDWDMGNFSQDIKMYTSLTMSCIVGSYSDSPVETTAEIMDELDVDDESSKELINFLCKGSTLDIDAILAKVEERIHYKIPYQIKTIVKLAYQEKVRELDEELQLAGYPEYEKYISKGKGRDD